MLTDDGLMVSARPVDCVCVDSAPPSMAAGPVCDASLHSSLLMDLTGCSGRSQN
jgi:hypothetical protein